MHSYSANRDQNGIFRNEENIRRSPLGVSAARRWACLPRAAGRVRRSPLAAGRDRRSPLGVSAARPWASLSLAAGRVRRSPLAAGVSTARLWACPPLAAAHVYRSPLGVSAARRSPLGVYAARRWACPPLRPRRACGPGEQDITLFLMRGSIAAIAAPKRLRIRWLEDARRDAGGLESSPLDAV